MLTYAAPGIPLSYHQCLHLHTIDTVPTKLIRNQHEPYLRYMFTYTLEAMYVQTFRLLYEEYMYKRKSNVFK